MEKSVYQQLWLGCMIGVTTGLSEQPPLEEYLPCL